MKRGAPDHWKMKMLARLLGVRKREAVGMVEMMTHFASQYYPRGNIGRAPNTAIAEECDWDGDADKFVDAMVESGWFDRNEQHRLLVHDWHDHADGAVRKALKRAKTSFLTRVSGQRPPTAADVETCPDNGGNLCPDVRPALPCPALPFPSQPIPPLAAAPRTRRKNPPAEMPPIPESLNTPEFNAAWSDWLAYKAERRESYKPRGAKATLTEISAMGPARASAAIRHSMAMSWKGIYEKNVQNGKAVEPAKQQIIPGAW